MPRLPDMPRRLIAGFLVTLCFITTAQADPIVIGRFRDSYFAPFIQPLIGDAYKALGREVDFYDLPPKRSVVIANQGKIDGELIRPASVSNAYPNLVAIKIPVTRARLVAATWHDSLEAKSFNDFADLKVGYLNGQVYFEKHVKGSPRIAYNSFADLYAAAQQRLVLAIMLPHHHAQTLIKDGGEDNILRIMEPDMGRLDLFHVLHKKHADLIEQMTRQLQTMEKDGAIAWHNTVLRDKIYQ